MEKKRIAWIDIYKCLVIILVVIGHSTGLFNKYIYQFHMAAFFFISGYVAKLDKKSMGNVLVNKFFTLLLPVCTFFVIGKAFILILSQIGFSGVFFPEVNLDAWGAVRQFLHKGDMDVQFLGACWFLTVLFGIFLLQKAIMILCGNKYCISYVIANFLIYAFGYYLVSLGKFVTLSFFAVDLICIGQIFFVIGSLASQIQIPQLTERNKILLRITVLVLNVILFWYFGNANVNLVDYPSRAFNNMWMDLFTGLNGIVFIYNISGFLEKVFKKSQKYFEYIGQNTLGILIFHFLTFKIWFAIFYKMGIMQKEEIQAVVPPQEVGNRFWLIFTITALVLSLGIWELCKRIPVLRFLTGNQKMAYQKITQILGDSFLGKISCRIKEKMDKIRIQMQFIIKDIKRHPYIALFTLVLIIAVLFSMYQQGIMCNDELQTRFWSYQGANTFYNHYVEEYIVKGRALSIPIITISLHLGFIGGQMNWLFKIPQIISTLVVVIFFGVLIYKLFLNKYFAYFCSIFSLAFLPITFEHTAPNAFVALFNVPFAMLLCSMIWFIDYLEQKKRWKLIWSMIFLFIAQTSYEAFITFVPVYLMFMLYKYGFKNSLKQWKTALWPIGNAIIFLVMYVISGIVFASNYEGNQIAGIHIKESLIIIKELFLASFPGYWLLTPKYQYFFQTLRGNLQNYVLIAFVLLVSFSVCISFLLRKRKNGLHGVKKNHIWILICGLLAVVLPTLPISVAGMYQGNVGPNGFMALPVNFFGYFAAVFVCCFVLWQICRLLKSKLATQIILLGMLVVFFQVQMMNIVFAKEQNDNFKRLVSIENMIKSDIFAKSTGQKFYSEDIYKVQHTLAVHDGYWSQYAAASGRNIEFLNMEGTIEDNRIYLNDDEKMFQIWINDFVCIISNEKFPKHTLIHYYGKEYLEANCENISLENGWYIDYFVLENDILTECTKDMFLEQTVGSDITSYMPLEGIYEDGWLSKNSRFKIRTGESGMIHLEFYNPDETKKEETLQIYINGEQKEEIILTGGKQQIEVMAEPKQIVECNIVTDMVQSQTNGDTRELSVHLDYLEGK